MTRQQFNEQRTEDISNRYKAMRIQKMKRADAFNILAAEFELSHASLSSIISRSSYQKPLPKSVKNS